MNENEKIRLFYESYDEEGRLFRDKAHLPEYLTTIRYLDMLLAPNSRILDACAGTGRYAFYLAGKGHRVVASDLVEHNADLMKANPQACMLESIEVCDVMDMSPFKPDSFDAVLCMGAMYHLASDEQRTLAIRNCAGLTKPGGLVVLSYMNRFAVIAAELRPGLGNLSELVHEFAEDSDGFWKATTPARMEACAREAGLEVDRHLGADGISFVIADKVNAATDEDFGAWMEYIYATCEDPCTVGASMHGLLVASKPGF